MEKKININQVEQLTGVSKRNIRFYENEGLLNPERDEVNGYRKYGEEDIWRIKMIKMLRMLDMPLEEIGEVLDREQTLEQAVSKQQERLEEKAKELQAAILFCDQLKSKEIQNLNVEECLAEMEQGSTGGFFADWVDDYKKVKNANQDRDFSFIPDEPIQNAREFTKVLFDYAEKENLNLVLTKESMYPEFTIDGVEYTAERIYFHPYDGVMPVAMVRCHVKDREIKGENIPEGRKKILWFMQKYWLVLLMAVVNLGVIVYCIVQKADLQGWVVAMGSVGVLWLRVYWQYYFHFNEKL